MSSVQSLRIGFIGAGANTRDRHLPLFLKIPGVEAAVVCNRSRASSEKVATQFNIPRIAESWEEVAADPEVDALCIGTWPNMHAPITLAGLAHGKHILTEARMAMNLTEARAMYAALKAHPDLVGQIVPSPFALDFNDTVHEFLEAGTLGDLREVHIRFCAGMAASAEAPLTWRQDTTLSGHNTMTLGILHEIVQHWLGEIEPLWVQADAIIHTPQRPGPDGALAPVTIPDALDVYGRFSNGARLVYHFDGLTSGSPINEIRLHGSAASLRFNLNAQRLYLAEAGQSKEREISVPEDKRRGWRVEADFIESIRNGSPVRYTPFSEGVRYMRLTDAIWQSWNDQGRRVELSTL